MNHLEVGSNNKKVNKESRYLVYLREIVERQQKTQIPEIGESEWN